MLDRKKAPEIHHVGKLTFQEPNYKKLDNGVEIAMLKIGSQEVVHVEFIFRTGMAQAENLVIPTLALDMISTASKNFSSGEIAEKIDYYGAFLDSSLNMDFITFSVFSLSKYIDEVLLIFKDALVNVVYNSNEVNIHLKNHQGKLKTDLEKVQYLCLKEFNKTIFKDHPYGNSIELNDYSNIESSMLKEFHQNTLNPDLLNIIVSGNFDDNLYSQLNNCFGSLQGVTQKENQRKLLESSPQKIYVSKKNAVQSALRIGKLLNIDYGSKEYVVFKVLNTVLGGYFGSRLMSNIREEKGYTYGINSLVISYELATFFVISSEIKGDVEADALQEIYKEISKLRENLISEDELDTVKSYMLGSILKSIDGPFLVAEQLKLFKLKGKGLDYLNEFCEMIKTVTAEQLKECAIKHLDIDSLSEVVVGNRGNK